MTTPTHSHKAWTDKGGHVSCSDLLVHAVFEQARSVYEHLMLLLKDIRRTPGSLPR